MRDNHRLTKFSILVRQSIYPELLRLIYIAAITRVVGLFFIQHPAFQGKTAGLLPADGSFLSAFHQDRF